MVVSTSSSQRTMSQTPWWGSGSTGEVSAEDAAVLARFEAGIFGKPLSEVDMCGASATAAAQGQAQTGDTCLGHTVVPPSQPCLTTTTSSSTAGVESLAHRKRPLSDEVLGIASAPGSQHESKRHNGRNGDQAAVLGTLTRPGPVISFTLSRPGGVPVQQPSGPVPVSTAASLGRLRGAPPRAAERPWAERPWAEQPRAAEPESALLGAKTSVSAVCQICLRGFGTEAKLRRHEERSELHRQNLARLREEI